MITWARTVGELSRSLIDGTAAVAIVDPRRPARRERWERALRWLGVPDNPAAAGGPRPRSGAHLLLSVGSADAHLISGAYAPRLGRTHRRCNTPTEALAELARTTASSALVVLPAKELGHAMTRRLIGLTVEPGLAIGAVPFGDIPGLSFHFAKMVLAATAPRRPSAWSDGLGGWSEQFIESGDLATSLRDGTFGSVVLGGHGDGAHLHMADALLCGLVEDAEHLLDGTVVPGCDATKRTCRIEDDYNAVVHPKDIKATAQVFLSCISLAVAGEFYPSDNSMVMSALEGYTVTVIGSGRRALIEDNAAQQVASLFDNGASPATVAHVLNDSDMEEPSWLVVGDPTWSNGAPSEPAGRVARSRPPVADASPDHAAIEEWMRRASLGLAWAAMFETRLDAALNGPRGRRIAEALEPLRSARTAAEQACRDLWLTACAERDPAGLRVPRDAAMNAVSAWDTAMAEVARRIVFAPEMGGWLPPYALSDTFYRRTSAEPGPVCGHCGTRTTAWVSQAPALPARVMVECDLCGPVAERRYGSRGAAVEVAVPPGIPPWIEVGVRSAKVRPDQRAAWVSTVHDRTKPVAKVFGPVVVRGGEHRERYDLPADSGYEVYKVQGLLIAGLEVEYVRRNIAVVP
jgi:hypothetical protein